MQIINQTTANFPKAAPSQPAAKSKSTKGSTLNYITLLLIAAVLKYKSSAEHPLGTKEIAEEFFNITGGQQIDQRNIIRHLTPVVELTRTAESQTAASKSPSHSLTPEQTELNALISVMGGSIHRDSKNSLSSPNSPNAKKVYYFKPLINDSEFDLIKGAMISNRYVQAEDKKYLIDILYFLHPDVTDNISEKKHTKGIKDPHANRSSVLYEAIPRCPKPTMRSRFSSDAALFISHINTIYDAIHQDYQLILTYGAFEENSNRINLVPYGKKERVINPYAVLWSNGNNYLIATDSDEVHSKGDSEPVNIYHFRVDRICELKIAKIPAASKAGAALKKNVNVPRDNCPENLIGFFKNSTLTDFDENRYRSTHPLMSFSDRNKKDEDVLINCSKRCLSVLVDNFGQNSEFIKGETINTQNMNINLPFPKDKGYTIRIRDVDYNSIKRLCLNMQDDMYVIAPASLRLEIISELERKLNIYKQL
jgi:hypothetical protein